MSKFCHCWIELSARAHTFFPFFNHLVFVFTGVKIHTSLGERSLTTNLLQKSKSPSPGKSINSRRVLRKRSGSVGSSSSLKKKSGTTTKRQQPQPPPPPPPPPPAAAAVAAISKASTSSDDDLSGDYRLAQTLTDEEASYLS
jgi:hypothetical protein